MKITRQHMINAVKIEPLDRGSWVTDDPDCFVPYEGDTLYDGSIAPFNKNENPLDVDYDEDN